MNQGAKVILKSLVPPILFDLYHRRLPRSRFVGSFVTWDDALTHSVGYDSEVILAKVTEASLKVKRGEAVYERDSVLFDTIEYSWPLLSGLLMAAARNGGVLNLLDLGGSLGSSYFQNRKFLRRLVKVRWNIVEQKNFVEVGKKHFQDRELRFYDNLKSCVRKEKPTVAVLSSVLPYMEKPYNLLKELFGYHLDMIIIDRTMFVNEGSERIVVQHVPQEIYRASYPCWMFRESKFLAAFSGQYRLVESFDAHAGTVLDLDDTTATFKGFIFCRQ